MRLVDQKQGITFIVAESKGDESLSKSFVPRTWGLFKTTNSFMKLAIYQSVQTQVVDPCKHSYQDSCCNLPYDGTTEENK